MWAREADPAIYSHILSKSNTGPGKPYNRNRLHRSPGTTYRCQEAKSSSKVATSNKSIRAVLGGYRN